MRIEDLKIFVDVVRYHSMNIASEKNYTTPQNLSKIIKRMEDELGVVLFKRSKKGSELTEAGERFYLHIIEVLTRYDDAIAALYEKKLIKNNGEIEPLQKVSVLCTSGALSYAVMNAYNKIQNEYGNLLLDNDEINFSNIQQVSEYAEGKDYDIIACFVEQEHIDDFLKALPAYTLLHIIFDELVLVVSNQNPICSRRTISLSEICNLNLISFKGFCLSNNLLGDDIQYHIMTNSHAKALEQIKNSDLYGALLFKKFCEMNRDEFSENGKLRMISLDKKIMGTYLLLVKTCHLKNKVVMHFISKMEENFSKTVD